MKPASEKLEYIAKKLTGRVNIYFFLLLTTLVFGVTTLVFAYYHKSKTSYLVSSVSHGLDEAIKQNDNYAIDKIIGPLISGRTISYFQVMLGNTLIASSESFLNSTYKKSFEIDKYRTLVVDRVILTVDGEDFSVYIGYYIDHLHILIFLLALIGCIALINLLIKRSFTKLTQGITRPLIEFAHDLTQVDGPFTKEKSYHVFEIDELKTVFDKLLSDSKKINTLIAQDKIIKQIIHDIKAPLAALKTISQNSKTLENDILRSSINRINQISNELFQKQTHREHNPITHFGLALTDVINEKAVFETRHLSIHTCVRDIQHCWGKINTTDFQRTISNLVDNAIDSLKFRPHGIIEIKTINKTDTIEIFIKDNGRGIPKDILEQLQIKGFSYKKQSGNGLGLEYARKKIHECGGTLTLSSLEGEGTTVTTTFPKCRPPDWLCETLSVPENPRVCIIDDVLSIHQVWKQKFQQNFSSFHIESLFKLQDQVPESDLYIVDYEFEDQDNNGLNFIIEKGLKNAYLCTSHYEGRDVQNMCRQHDIKMIPKDFISNVSFHVFHKYARNIVHLDDDPLMRMIWKKEAKNQHIDITSFSNSSDLKKHLGKIDKSTPLYIDQNLGEDVEGIIVAKELAEKGFDNIFISSGYEHEQFQDIPFVKKSVGKTPPTNLIPANL